MTVQKNMTCVKNTRYDNTPDGQRITHDQLTKAITDTNNKYHNDLVRLATDEDVDKALDYIDDHYSEVMKHLSNN